MEIKLKPGKYIVAVSGGIDSMVLLDLLAKQAMSHKPGDKSEAQDSGLRTQDLVVAHFDHGIHERSADYCDFVAEEVKKLGLEFTSEKGHLGPKTSEAAARKARYDFLTKIKRMYVATAIITAHHQDDLIETIFINIIRGTGRKGLISLSSNNGLIRPLLNYSKQQIENYAQKYEITWREDPTNKDETYLRNYLRQKILPKLDVKTRQKLLKIAAENKTKDKEIMQIIASIIESKSSLDIKIFNRLDHGSSREVLADFLRRNKISFDSKLIDKCVNFIKTAKEGKKFSLSGRCQLRIQDNKAKLNLL